jgi:hypothetical protein
LAVINDFVYKKFNEAMAKKLIIHDIDLKRWAIFKNREVGLTAFVASKFWLLWFKHKYRIVSRKIIKYVSVPQIEESESIMEISRNFVQNAV